MYYRIRFKAAPEEFVFEAVRYFVTVKDIVKTVRKTFNIYQSNLHVFDERGTTRLQEKHSVENGRTYIVRRVPAERVKYKRKLRLYT